LGFVEGKNQKYNFRVSSGSSLIGRRPAYDSFMALAVNKISMVRKHTPMSKGTSGIPVPFTQKAAPESVHCSGIYHGYNLRWVLLVRNGEERFLRCGCGTALGALRFSAAALIFSALLKIFAPCSLALAHSRRRSALKQLDNKRILDEIDLEKENILFARLNPGSLGYITISTVLTLR
jgi:hypothetical protein